MPSARTLPSGNVTFAFTDIEGSTQMLRRIGDDRYGAVLDRHDEILRHSWQKHGGFEVGNEGDSFFVAFDDPSAACLACCDAQIALSEERWDPDAIVRVRMGIHAGLAKPRGSNYASLTVHQASRVMTAASGAQVFTTAEVIDQLSGDFSPAFESVGRYRVRDFETPIELFAAHDPAWPANSSPPRVPPVDIHNLVLPRTSLADRDDEFEQLPPLLRPGALVTLLGPGGVGKTRLATEIGVAVAPTWADGAWLASLEQASSFEAVVAAVADATGLAGQRSDDLTAALLEHYRGRELLLILDNCEHVVEHCRRLVTRLRAESPGIAVLATSRSPLDLVDERVWRLAALATSSSTGSTPPAVQLFKDRVHLGEPVALDSGTYDQAVATLCAKLDGLPLAIEIAAANAHRMPIETLAARLDEGYVLPKRPDPVVSPRHRSLDAALNWSYELLDQEPRHVLAGVCDLPGGFELDAALVGTGGSIDASDVALATWSLVDDSLVQPDRASGTDRYRLLSVVRNYVVQRVDVADRDATKARLIRHFVERLGPEQAPDRQWTAALGTELDNLRSLATAQSDASLNDRHTLVWLIGRYLDLTDQFAPAVTELTSLTRQVPGPTPELVAVRTLLADLHLRRGDLAAAESSLEKAEALASKVGSPSWDDASVARLRGDLALRKGSPALALDLAEEAIIAGLSPRGEARIWNLIGLVHAGAENNESARAAFDAELSLLQELGFEAPQATTLGNLAEVALRAGDEHAAAQYQLGCLDLAVELGQPVMSAFSIIVAARLAASQQRWSTAVRLQGAADAALEKLSYVLYESDQLERSAMLEQAEDALSPSKVSSGLTEAATVDVATALGEAAEVLRSLA
ncbi:MAG: ATP-binding protein [Acidimicrobiales bacterium]